MYGLGPSAIITFLHLALVKVDLFPIVLKVLVRPYVLGLHVDDVLALWAMFGSLA